MKISWMEAYRECEKLGMSLPSINSIEDMLHIYKGVYCTLCDDLNQKYVYFNEFYSESSRVKALYQVLGSYIGLNLKVRNTCVMCSYHIHTKFF